MQKYVPPAPNPISIKPWHIYICVQRYGKLYLKLLSRVESEALLISFVYLVKKAQVVQWEYNEKEISLLPLFPSSGPKEKTTVT